MKAKEVPITVTFRHIAATDALRAHAEKKLTPVVALVPGATDVHVVLTTSPHHHRQSCEIKVLGAHHVLTAREETDDMYAAIDLAASKLQSQVRKLKGKVIQEPRRNSTGNRKAGSSSATA